MKPPPSVFFVTLPETNIAPGWNTIFLLGRPIFRCYVSFRECSFRDDNCLNETKGLIILLRFMVMGVEPKIGVGPQNGWFIMENPIF